MVEAHVRKYKWIPNGEAEIDTGWGDNGEFIYNINCAWWDSFQGLAYVGENTLVATNTNHSGGSRTSELILIDVLNGTEIRRIDLSDWWINLADEEAGGQSSSGPTQLNARNGLLFLNAHSSCMNQVIDPLEESESDWNIWVNRNGDYTGDHNFEEDADRPWVCNDYNVAPYKYQISPNAHLFSVFPTFDLGAVSFGMYAPDGTGLGYYAYAGESAAFKGVSAFVDYNSPFDGMYSDNISGEGAGWWYVANDSFMGVITSKPVGIDEQSATAFSVAQNSPNPFNPTTTINFSTAESANVSIDIFNAAGQKVDTIVNGFMVSGNHSVIWNASDYSAGVYFYTIKAGEFSNTMKMTLLK